MSKSSHGYEQVAKGSGDGSDGSNIQNVCDLPNTCDAASWFSYMVFNWPGPLVKMGASKTLQLKDLPRISVHDDSRKTGTRLLANWRSQVQKHGKDKASMWVALAQTFWKQHWFGGLLLVAESVARIYQAIVLGKIIRYFLGEYDDSTRLLDNGYFMSLELVLCGIFVMMIHHHAFYLAWRSGLQMRVALTGVIYDKAVNLSLRSLADVSVGHVVNLSAQDVEGFQLFGCFFHFLYQPIFEASMILYFGIQEIGMSFLAGFAIILLLIPLQALFSRLMSAARRKTSALTDERVKLINQALTGARLMKINGWENVFKSLIEAVRSKEIKAIMKSQVMRGLNEAIFFAAPVMIAFITFTVFTKAEDGVLNMGKVFVVMSYFSIVQFSFTKFFAMAVMGRSESAVALNRIRLFLLREDNENELATEATGGDRTSFAASPDFEMNGAVELTSVAPAPVDDGNTIVFKSFNASWTDLPIGMEGRERTDTAASVSVDVSAGADGMEGEGEGKQLISRPVNHPRSLSNSSNASDSSFSKKDEHARGNVLQNINLSVKKGELVVIVGPVGCSKTSLLMAILGELKVVSGNITVRKEKFAGNERERSGGDLQVASADRKAGGKFDDDQIVNPADEGGSAWIKYSDEDALELVRAALREEQRGEGIAYCAQEPWIMSDTLANNILFGKPFIASRYNDVIIACSLETDLKELPNGDMTIIGDKGVNLSGGQRARVGLARALYADTSIILFDDPLSAVDSHVGSHLFNAAICQYAPHATRVLVTHQTQFLSSESIGQIIVMDHGKIARSGTYAELLATGELNNVGNSGSLSDEELVVVATGNKSAEDLVKLDSEKDDASPSPPSDTTSTENVVVALDASKTVSMDPVTAAPVPSSSIIVKEDVTSGDVKLSTYQAYVSSLGGTLVCATIFLLMIGGQVSVIYTNLWLAKWSRLDAIEQKKAYYWNIYVILVVVSMFFSCIRALFAFRASLVASEAMHNAMLKCVLRAPVLFFDSNPIGRILNRFTKDINYTDDALPFSLYDFLQCVLMVIGAICVVCAGSPIIFAALIPLVIYFHLLRVYFLKASREIKRLEAVSRSPVFSHLSETLDGLVTIRALNCTRQFQALHKKLLNDNCRAFFAFMAASRWLGFRLDATTVALLAFCTFGAVACKEYKLPIDPNLLAVGIMYVLQLMGLFQWAVRQSVEVDNQMVSVERIVAYSNLASEPALHGPANVGAVSTTYKDAAISTKSRAADDRHVKEAAADPSDITEPQSSYDITIHRPNWPEHGRVESKNLWAYYRSDLPAILRNLSFVIKPGSRVGVVGRTGAGKSTLVAALLRLVDTIKGEILIDGVPIQKVGLHDLRPRISVIPQTPFLFSGTIRKNLDPFDTHTDKQIWDALDATGLRSVVGRLASAPNDKAAASASASKQVSSSSSTVSATSTSATPKQQLQDIPLVKKEKVVANLLGLVEEGGLNFSTGERQLVCLARAILQRNKILIMDEATANIDLETDKKVQKAIHEQFSKQGTTVITIAHRLHTVIDCDQILVLAHGELCENGSPHQLLSDYFGDVQLPISGTGASKSITADEEVLDKTELQKNDVSSVHPPRHSFASLVKQTGPEMCFRLRKLAKSAAAASASTAAGEGTKK